MNTTTEVNTITFTKEQVNGLKALFFSQSNNSEIKEYIKSQEKKESEPKKKGCLEVLKSGNYRFKYQFKGTVYRETFEGLKDIYEAEKELKLWVISIEDGSYQKKNLNISTWCQIWLDEQVRPNSSGDRTPNKYKNFMNNRFLPKFGNRYLKSITMEDLTKYFNKLKLEKTMYKDRENHLLSSATLEKYHSIIHAMFETAKLWGKIPINPCPPKAKINFNVLPDGSPREVKPSNTINTKIEDDINYYSKKEYDTVLALLDKEWNEILNNSKLSDKDKHFKLGRIIAIEFDFKTGLRRSELYALAKEDFNLEEATVRISKTRQLTKSKGKQKLITKNSTSKRIVTIPKAIISKLKIFLELTPDFFDYIFEDFSIDGLSSFWQDFQENYNLRKITFHDIRHTHASILFFLGLDIKVISQRLGHKSVQTTEKIYLVIIVELRQKVSKQIDNL